ncbi:hypothetical protein TA3x_001789 [Tundrisphaera sp. TA3]|uniref:hypothetical protein n=1 Tax=Tundrisphaera sp. TA3 TaxID=3435775 RepID=UPI003EB6F640
MIAPPQGCRRPARGWLIAWSALVLLGPIGCAALPRDEGPPAPAAAAQPVVPTQAVAPVLKAELPALPDPEPGPKPAGAPAEVARALAVLSGEPGEPAMPTVAAITTPPPPVPEAAPPPLAGDVLPPIPIDLAAKFDPAITPAACASCGQRYPVGVEPIPGMSCGRAGCVPGHKNCYAYEPHTFVGRVFANMYECLCCPDPCYEPRWVPEANAAFFQDYARPRTLQRFRWDHGIDLRFPDRSEYFWARDDGKGDGPKPPPRKTKAGRPRRGTKPLGEGAVTYDQLYLYTEAATGRFAFFTEFSYRTVYPDFEAFHSGFGDMNLGTKSLLLDCELMQVSFQFKTFLPIGSASKGLGTGHVSLEPSLLASIRLADETYLQAQLAEWIPIGGDPTYAGALLHYHFSLNHVLYKVTPDVPIIGTMEFNGWSFQDGAYTNPYARVPMNSSGASYLSLGPGIRMSICDKIDFGSSVALPLTSPSWGDATFRTEFRILY